MVLLSEAHLAAGNLEEAMGMAENALASVQRTGERQFESLVLSAKGDALRAVEKREEAARCYRTAIDVARTQSAKSWELRAATRLARLWRDQGETAAARDFLAPVYNWFTEGFDTADLKEAKGLLDELE
jgi:predicted ATPase